MLYTINIISNYKNIPKMKYPEINFDVIPKHTFSLFIGKRGSGKTNLIIEHTKNICKKRPIEKIFIIDPSEKYQKNYQNLGINNFFVYYSFDLTTWITITEEIDKLNKEYILIMDNITIHPYLKDTYRDIVFNFKNMCLTVLFGQQFLESQISKPEYINNYDLIFLGQEYNTTNLKRYNDMFFPFITNFDKFKKDFNKNTTNFNFLVYHKATHTFFSHNAKYLLIIDNNIFIAVDYSDLMDVVDWLGVEDDYDDIIFPKIKESDITYSTRICIEV
ncbi:putative ORFan [Tupanvirus deep ocean]|uniref:ORFan n=2 Tax=Tupanvirus TaxID=2094720 RepID=A0AC62A830_9VIRU|nr:putative ORFan [Tupanvirus deep ocean]QKU33894.1 putative ORFan [Tupanvirus deep ocean]